MIAAVTIFTGLNLAPQRVAAQKHIYNRFGTEPYSPPPPTLFLDQPPRVVEFQLRRLDDERLAAAPRRSDDPKFVPVYREILSRPGMEASVLAESVNALVTLEGTDAVSVILDAIARTGSTGGEDRSRRPGGGTTVDNLTRLLLNLSAEQLDASESELTAAADGTSFEASRAALAALVAMGRSDAAIQLAKGDKRRALISGLPLVQSTERRADLTAMVIESLEQTSDPSLRKFAATAMATLPMPPTEKFDQLAALISDPAETRDAAVRAMLKVPEVERDSGASEKVCDAAVTWLQKTQPADRTSPAMIRMVRLARQCAQQLSSDKSTAKIDQLNRLAVQKVDIATVEEEMRYDTPYFAVAAGRQVQVRLINNDIMPHNLVIGRPGSLQRLVAEGLAAGPTGVDGGPGYVGTSDDVLVATDMVNADETDRLTFQAPDEPGEYPYVCTFPQHWYRMYGVMVVVEDLEAFEQNPTPPSDPTGNQRRFVADWTMKDFANLQSVMADRDRASDVAIGTKIFSEASCAGCHAVGTIATEGLGGSSIGGGVGPAMDDLYLRYKGDHAAVLRSILHPSETIDPKYVMQKVLTVDGTVISGVLQRETDDAVFLLTGAADQPPVEIAQEDIDAMLPSKVSIMPKALLNQYEREEIYGLLAYLESLSSRRTD